MNDAIFYCAMPVLSLRTQTNGDFFKIKRMANQEAAYPIPVTRQWGMGSKDIGMGYEAPCFHDLPSLYPSSFVMCIDVSV